MVFIGTPLLRTMVARILNMSVAASEELQMLTREALLTKAGVTNEQELLASYQQCL